MINSRVNPPQGPLPDRNHLGLLLEQVEGRLGTQRDEWDGLDKKATTILGATGVLFGLVVSNTEPLAATPQPGPRLFLASLVVLIGGVVVGILSLAPRRIATVPEPTPLIAGYAGAATDVTLGTLITTKAQVFDFNRDVLDSKLRFLGDPDGPPGYRRSAVDRSPCSRRTDAVTDPTQPAPEAQPATPAAPGPDTQPPPSTPPPPPPAALPLPDSNLVGTEYKSLTEAELEQRARK